MCEELDSSGRVTLGWDREVNMPDLLTSATSLVRVHYSLLVVAYLLRNMPKVEEQAAARIDHD